jgi:hypothetical protein
MMNNITPLEGETGERGKIRLSQSIINYLRRNKMRKYLVVLLITALLSFAGCGGGSSSAGGGGDDGGGDGGGQTQVTALAFNTWADGFISAVDGEEAFTFTAADAVLNIYVKFGSLTRLNIQLYDSNDNKVGNEAALSGSNTSVKLTSLTVGTQYTIKVTPYSSPDSPDDTYSGTYQIAFNTSTAAPLTALPSDAIALTVNNWGDGNIQPNGTQWFKVTAASALQYIHVSFETLSSLYFQVYDSGGTLISTGALTNGSSGYFYATIGNIYYIKVLPYFTAGSSYSGTYRIAVGASSTAPIITPPSNATQLNFNSWANVNITTPGGAQWFKFTANADTQYFHVIYGTLTGLSAQLYTLKDVFSTAINFNTANPANRTSLIVDQEYYLKVWPSDNKDSGTYQIAFNASRNAPAVKPPADATVLTVDTPEDGNITAPGGSQWFKFNATAATQYIQAAIGTLTNINVQLYNNKGAAIGSATFSNITKSSGAFSSLTVGQEYYIKVTPSVSKVTPSISSVSGTFRIMFSATNTAIILPTDASALTANTFADGNITVFDGEQWFKFTATAGTDTATGTQYIHAGFGTLTSLSVRVYNSEGAAVGTQANINNTSSTKYTTRTVTKDQVYYICVTPYIQSSGFSYSGAYKIAFNTSSSRPFPPNSTALTAGTWTDGYITAAVTEQFFKFTATEDGTQYIHFNFGPQTRLYYQVYDSEGATVVSQTYLDVSKSTNLTVTSDKEYFINVTQYYSYIGPYKIALSTSSTAPALIMPANAPALTANTWADGNITEATGEQWFKFTATAASQFIYADFGTLNSSTGIYVQLYNSDGAAVGSYTNLYGTTKSVNRPSLTAGQVYYVKVMPSMNQNSVYFYGTYKIAFSAAPYFGSVTELTAGAWANGNIPTSDGEQWFKITATAATQYIHVKFGTLLDLNVQVYNSTGGTVTVTNSNLTSTSLIIAGKQFASCNLTSGDNYYIKITPYNTRKGDYSIAFNASDTAPQ